MKFILENFLKTFVISNEYVTSHNKQIEARNHGQSKLKFKSTSNFFRDSKKQKFKNKLGKNETNDDFSYEGQICFIKKHIIQFFIDLKPIYERDYMNYKNININDWEKIFREFSDKYKKFKDKDIIIEKYTTTCYRYHEQGLEFDLYKNFIFKIAIPYASKIIFYKIKNKNLLFFIPKVDFSLLQTSYFEKLRFKKEKTYKKIRSQQSKWREKIISTYRYCILTSLKSTDVLEAAHIKPYCKCDKNEQYSINNGILLSSTFHKFFDQGFISFDYITGELLCSNFLIDYDKEWIKRESYNFKTLKSLCLSQKLNWEQMSKFLKFHNEHIFVNN